MKKSLLMSAILVAAGTAANAQVTLFDYSQATSAYTDAYLTGSFSTSKTRSDDQSSFDAFLGAKYNTAFDSANTVYSFNASAEGIFSRGSNEGDKSVDNYNVSVEGKMDNYFNPQQNDAFWYGGLGLKGNNLTSPDDALDADNLQYTADIGVGYGRVVNVTPMARAIRVVEELQSRGLMSGTPSKQTYNAVAGVINKKDQFRSQYGNKAFEAEWVKAVAAALGTSIDAAGGIAIRDVLIDEKISTRKHGYLVRAGLGYTGNTADFLDDDPSLVIEADYHRPLSNQTQFSNELELRSTLGDGASTYTAENLMTLTYEVSDNLDWENSLKTDFFKPDEGDNILINTAKTSFNYEINNALDFNVSASIVNEKGGANEGTDRFMGMGFTYRLR